jgi:hypothetical protein
MELVLNLAWLLLALPAFWLWRGSRTPLFVRRFTALQCVLALGCMLFILFPVISATDDLRAMRNEVEESPASKRTLRLVGCDRVSPSKWQSPPALVASAPSFVLNDEGGQQLPAPRISVSVAPSTGRSDRAPPESFLA